MNTLIVMRLAEMVRVHPRMITDKTCDDCGHQVGIYPSGQNVIRQNQSTRIVCNHCQSPEGAQLAPGAAIEPFQSVRKR